MLVALVAGLPATLSVVLAYRIHRQLQTPSGAPIGAQVEQTNHLAEVNTIMTGEIHKRVTNGYGHKSKEG